MTTTESQVAVMLDIETMGLVPGSAVTAIGAVVFCPRGAATGSVFYRAITLKSNVDVGLKINPDTVTWWMQQPDAARNALFVDAVPLVQALDEFRIWLDPLLPIWSNGPNFDISNLGAAYAACGLPEPWHYRSPRCVRTIIAAAGLTKDELADTIPAGTAHNALDDAVWQARAVQIAYARLGLK